MRPLVSLLFTPLLILPVLAASSDSTHASALPFTSANLPSDCVSLCKDLLDEINQGFTGVMTNNTGVWSKCAQPDCVCTTTNSIDLGNCADCVGSQKLYDQYVSTCKSKTGKDIPAFTVKNSNRASVLGLPLTGVISMSAVVALSFL